MRSIIAAVVVLSSAVLTAQSVPNLSGTWTIDRDKTAAMAPAAPAASGGGARASGGAVVGGIGAVAAGGAAPPEWVITQTPAALTIVRALPDGTQQKFVYKLDGSESVNVNGRTTQKTRTTVAGGRLTTVGSQSVTTDQGDVLSEIKEVRWLEKDGSMVVEMTRTVNESVRTTTQVFAKKK
jgi:hypothetical protein